MITNCFIIMGFNIKTTEDGKEYNLNLSYNEIIKPVLEELKINYIRADEIMLTELIDESMYKLLLCADLVIADITTLNANALYELGIRYALKPYSTVIIGDSETRLPFDINHIRMFSYKHSGLSIDEEESKRIRMQITLKEVIKNISEQYPSNVDSPVYKFITNLIPPKYIGDNNYFEKTTKRFKSSESLGNLIAFAYKKRDAGDFESAIELYNKALLISKDEYIVKEIAVCIYQKGTNDSYIKALDFIKSYVDIQNTTNPEILKTLGPIYKNLWIYNNFKEYAEQSLVYYEKSFVIFNSYNSGLNYGFMLLAMATYYKDEMDNPYLLWCKQVYKKVAQICLSKYDVNDYWVNASLEECYFVLGNSEEYKKYKKLAKTCLVNQLSKTKWKRDKTLSQIKLIKKLLQILN